MASKEFESGVVTSWDLPNFHTFDFENFGDSGIVDKALWTTVVPCSYFLLILLPAVAQSVFKKKWVPLGHIEWLQISFVFCFLQEICISFMLHHQRENQRKICLVISLSVCVRSWLALSLNYKNFRLGHLVSQSLPWSLSYHRSKNMTLFVAFNNLTLAWYKWFLKPRRVYLFFFWTFKKILNMKQIGKSNLLVWILRDKAF